MNYLFKKDYGIKDFQFIISLEKSESLSQISSDSRIVIHDYPFDEQLKSNSRLTKDNFFDFSILESSIIDYINRYRKKIESSTKKSKIELQTVLVSADDGFIEDNLEEILKAFQKITDKKLIIKIPNYEKLALTKFTHHNEISKKNQAFPIMLKYEIDELRLYNLIQLIFIWMYRKVQSPLH